MAKVISEGRHKGWITRNILSYPEKFFIEVLDSNGYNGEYQVNYPVKQDKGYNYFLDFAFVDAKIDVEIDGQQHLWREIENWRRDMFLESKGWVVWRILWKNPVTDLSSNYIKYEIKKLLRFLGSDS